MGRGFDSRRLHQQKEIPQTVEFAGFPLFSRGLRVFGRVQICALCAFLCAARQI
nr:MAG TPA: hypothetical protein [Caudoviricetes sp.]